MKEELKREKEIAMARKVRTNQMFPNGLIVK